MIEVGCLRIDKKCISDNVKKSQKASSFLPIMLRHESRWNKKKKRPFSGRKDGEKNDRRNDQLVHNGIKSCDAPNICVRSTLNITIF